MSARFWWANHSRAWRGEIEGSFLWLPKTRTRIAARNESYRNMRRVLPGDVIFSFAEGAVGAVGVALAPARQAPRPPELAGIACGGGADTGWLLPVRFGTLKNPLRPHEHEAHLGPAVLHGAQDADPNRRSAADSESTASEGVLLTAVPSSTATKLQHLLNGEVQQIVETVTQTVSRLADDAAEEIIQQRTDIGPVAKATLLAAREGQGLFRKNLESVEHLCRITGLSDRRHLKALHIKLWRACSDGEKLDACNGLLLSPHVAQLFDRGYLSFTDTGELMISSELNPAVLRSWNIELPRAIVPFRPEQCAYLEFHRREVFQHHGRGRRGKNSSIGEADSADLTDDPVIVNPPAVIKA